MKKENGKLDWIRIIVSAFLGGLLVGAVFLVRVLWISAGNVSSMALRVVILVILWIFFSYLIYRAIPQGGDSP